MSPCHEPQAFRHVRSTGCECTIIRKVILQSFSIAGSSSISPAYGWVIVDPADVLKFKLEKNPTSDELENKRKYFFGAVDESRIALNSGKISG